MSELIPSSYQLVHLMKLRTNKHNCLLIADGVGVGKTISSGYIISHQSRVIKKPVLVVCPPILVDKWRNELSSKFGIMTRLANDQERFSLMIDEISSKINWTEGPVYLTTYSTLSRLEKRNSPPLGLVVMDEIHHARNPKTKLYPMLRSICQNSDYRVGLSATPINNSISDLASILSILMTKYEFDDLEAMLEDSWGLPLIDSISCITTRFNKEQVSSHFTRRKIHNATLDYTEDYSEFVTESIRKRYPWAAEFELATISLHRMASSSPAAFLNALGMKMNGQFEDPKLSAFLRLISEKPDERWLVFTEFKRTAEYLANNIRDRLILSMSGDSTIEERQANTYLFRETNSSVLIMTPVGSEGLDFQVCSNLVNYDLHWNPMKIEQRIGRIDRIGQEKNEINIHNFLVNGSIDERVLSIIGKKLDLVSGSFADISSIVTPSDNSATSEIEQMVVETELEAAESLIKSSKFYDQISTTDSDVVGKIGPENCRFVNWDDLDWGDSFPWANQTIEWVNEVFVEAQQFASLLNSYCSGDGALV